MQHGIRTVIGVLALLTATACAPPPAQTTPPPADTTAAPAPATTPGGITLPPRPRDIAIDDIEPCSLLVGARTRLRLDGELRAATDQTVLLGLVRGCDVLGTEPRAVALGISLADTVGIERITTTELKTALTPMTVRGFPAVLNRPTRTGNFCSVAIDIAPGQLIDVQFRSAGRIPPVPQDELCRDVQAAASEVMATLLAR